MDNQLEQLCWVSDSGGQKPMASLFRPLWVILKMAIHFRILDKLWFHTTSIELSSDGTVGYSSSSIFATTTLV